MSGNGNFGKPALVVRTPLRTSQRDQQFIAERRPICTGDSDIGSFPTNQSLDGTVKAKHLDFPLPRFAHIDAIVTPRYLRRPPERGPIECEPLAGRSDLEPLGAHDTVNGIHHIAPSWLTCDPSRRAKRALLPSCRPRFYFVPVRTVLVNVPQE